MDIGLFMMPAHPPERSLYDGTQWDLQMLRWADAYGIPEAWVGEHMYEPWEPLPAPDILIAQALLQTERIRLGTGVHQTPTWNPFSLAYRAAYLDHLSQGRFMVGLGAAGGASETAAFHIDGKGHAYMDEAVQILKGVWNKDEPFDYQSDLWRFTRIDDPPNGISRQHIWPYTQPHPPIAMAGFSPKSSSLAIAGKHGLWPMSFLTVPSTLLTNWEAVEEGAAESGRTPDRADWRVAAAIFVADTDEEAYALARTSPYARFYEEFFIPVASYQAKSKIPFKIDKAMSDDEITLDYLIEKIWIVGSPETVAAKLAALNDFAGGFGNILLLGMDAADDPAPWRRSLELFATEVKPRIADL